MTATSNLPVDHDPRLDSGEDLEELDLEGDYDDSDEFRENNPHLFPPKEDDIPLHDSF